MSELNLRQKKFVDEYIICGNATESAINAGYSDKTARSQGQRLLTNADILFQIKERTERLFDDKAMSVKEALAITASIARGETQKSYSKKYDRIKKKIVSEADYEFAPSVEERQKSLEHILKVNGAFIDRQEINANIAPIFIDDISSDADG